jgi:YidC/Oxa1 family membrane protein insertase
VIAVVWVQSILDFIGASLAKIYDIIPNYGIAIILFTLCVRVLLLPLAIKQIRSMQAMQAIQPKLKALQTKYKGNRQKLMEEQQALYKEYGVNPLGGCLPLVLQFPILIALFAVLKVPGGVDHIPEGSSLHRAIVQQTSGVYFLGANLLCSAREAGSTIPVQAPKGKPVGDIKVLKCGGNSSSPVLVRIPYYAFALFMIGTTYFQQRQMQRASPGGVNQQQQMLTRVLPLAFGFTGYIFPAGLVVYWTTTNLIQIAQQHFMLPKKGEEPAPAKTAKPDDKPSRPGASGRTPSTQRRRPSGSSRSSGTSRRPGSGSTNPTKRSGNGGNRKKRPQR